MSEVLPAVARRSGRRKLLALLAIGAIATYVWTRPAPQVEFQAQGSAAPTPAGGELTTLSESQFEGVLVGLRGQPVIVNIWASWCSPCRTETPLLERTWTSHRSSLTILGVASKDTPGSAVGFMHEFDVTYPNVFDASGDIRRELGLRGFPTTYVFDASGQLRTTIVGGLTEQRLAAVLEDLGL